jgi:hypothetical protein
MAFTNQWNSAQPLDSQQANQLGLDLRSLKTDIQERMAQFASGTLGNIPVPEGVFGNGNNGVLYFATDQKKFYQWSGAAWVEAACWQTFTDLTVAPIVNPGVETTVNTITIPAAFMVAGYSVEVFALIAAAGVTANDNINLYVNGVKVSNQTLVGNALPFYTFEGHGLVLTNILMSFVSTANVGFNFVGGSATPFAQPGQIAINVANQIIVKTTIGANANCTYTPGGLYVKVHR